MFVESAQLRWNIARFRNENKLSIQKYYELYYVKVRGEYIQRLESIAVNVSLSLNNCETATIWILIRMAIKMETVHLLKEMILLNFELLCCRILFTREQNTKHKIQNVQLKINRTN